MRSSLALSEITEEQLQQQIWLKFPTAVARYQDDLRCHYSDQYYLLERVCKCIDNMHHFLIATGQSSTREIVEIKVALLQFVDDAFIMIPEWRVNPEVGRDILNGILKSNSPDDKNSPNFRFMIEDREKILLLQPLVQNVSTALHTLRATIMPLIARLGYFLETEKRLPPIHEAKELPLFKHRYTAAIFREIQKFREPVTGKEIQRRLRRKGISVCNDAMTDSRKELNDRKLIQDFGRKGMLAVPDYQMHSDNL